MGRIKVAAFAVRKKDCFTGNPCCQLALPRVSWFMTAACSRARGLWLENKGVLGFRSYETWVQNINSGCICTRKHLIKCIFKEIFCIKGIYLWFSHTNSSSYLMKVSVLIHENQYQFRLIFLRDGLWGNVNLDYYTETECCDRPTPNFQVQRNTATSWAKFLILGQLERYFMYMFKYYLLFK